MKCLHACAGSLPSVSPAQSDVEDESIDMEGEGGEGEGELRASKTEEEEEGTRQLDDSGAPIDLLHSPSRQ